MVDIVIQSWKTSLSVLVPQRIKFGVINAVKMSCGVLKDLIPTLRWLLVLDFFLTVTIAEAMAKKIRSGSGFTFLCLLMELNWFIIYGSIIIFSRKKDVAVDTITYLRTMFFRYLHFLFIFSAVLLFLFWVMLILNISRFPTLHWSLTIPFQIFELLIIFYWLDSNFKLIDFFASMEKAVNLIFYNFPVFVVFFCLLIGLDFLLRSTFSGTFQTASPILLNEKSIGAIKPLCGHFSQFKFILLKYSKTLIEIFWICMLFIFYDKKRNEYYHENIFEPQKNEPY
jgi:hypothetical protein